jgi:SHS2 domain-containing protein
VTREGGPADDGTRFDLRDHTADVAVEATAPTLGGVFAAVADGMAAAMCEDVPETGERRDIAVAAESREALLFDYLDELIYERDVQDVLPVDNDATVTETDGEWRVSASYRGVPLATVSAREVKAVTYSEMDLSERDAGWHAYVVLDV